MKHAKKWLPYFEDHAFSAEFYEDIVAQCCDSQNIIDLVVFLLKLGNVMQSIVAFTSQHPRPSPLLWLLTRNESHQTPRARHYSCRVVRRQLSSITYRLWKWVNSDVVTTRSSLRCLLLGGLVSPSPVEREKATWVAISMHFLTPKLGRGRCRIGVTDSEVLFLGRCSPGLSIGLVRTIPRPTRRRWSTLTLALVRVVGVMVLVPLPTLFLV